MLHYFKGITRRLSQKSNLISNGESILSRLPEYISALGFMEQRNWSMAEIDLRRCVDILGNIGEEEKLIQNFLLKRLAYSQKQQKKYMLCEKNLEKIVQNFKGNQKFSDDSLYFQSCTDLISQYLLTNPAKAVSLGQALKSSEDWKNFPVPAKKQITISYGVSRIQTALFLEEDYLPSIEALESCLTFPSSSYSGLLYNNLGICEWFFSSTEKAPILTLQKSIQHFESFPEPYSLQSSVTLKNKNSGKVLSTISEIYLNQHDLTQATNWAKAALKCSEEIDQDNIHRALILLGRILKINKNKMHAEGIFRSCMEMVKNKGDYSEAILLKDYAELLIGVRKRENESKEMIIKAEEIMKKIEKFGVKSYYLIYPEWEI